MSSGQQKVDDWSNTDLSKDNRQSIKWPAIGLLTAFIGVFTISALTNKRPLSNRLTESRVWAQGMIVGPFSCYAVYRMMTTPDSREEHHDR
eukprot:g14192.t1